MALEKLGGTVENWCEAEGRLKRNTLWMAALVALMATALSVAQTKNPASANKAAGKPPAGNIKKGKQLYDDYCGICHFTTNREKKVGPGLRGIYKRGKFADGKKVDDASMRTWILKGGTDMPAFEDSITREQIEDILAYMKTI